MVRKGGNGQGEVRWDDIVVTTSLVLGCRGEVLDDGAG